MQVESHVARHAPMLGVLLLVREEVVELLAVDLDNQGLGAVASATAGGHTQVPPQPPFSIHTSTRGEGSPFRPRIGPERCTLSGADDLLEAEGGRMGAWPGLL